MSPYTLLLQCISIDNIIILQRYLQLCNKKEGLDALCFAIDHGKIDSIIFLSNYYNINLDTFVHTTYLM